jgi:hypothetical protein
MIKVDLHELLFSENVFPHIESGFVEDLAAYTLFFELMRSPGYVLSLVEDRRITIVATRRRPLPGMKEVGELMDDVTMTGFFYTFTCEEPDISRPFEMMVKHALAFMPAGSRTMNPDIKEQLYGSVS